MPFDPDAEEPSRPVPRDPDSLRKSMTSTSVHECRSMHDARAQAFTNHAQQLRYPWLQELRNASVWHARAKRIMRSSCGILGSRNSATLAHTQYNGALLRRKHRSILGVRNICDASAPLLLRARKCVALHASAHLRGRAGPSPLFLTSPLHRQRARGAASAGAKAAATRAAAEPLVLPSPLPQPTTRRGSARNLERAWDGTLADRLTRTSTLAPPRRTVR